MPLKDTVQTVAIFILEGDAISNFVGNIKIPPPLPQLHRGDEIHLPTELAKKAGCNTEKFEFIRYQYRFSESGRNQDGEIDQLNCPLLGFMLRPMRSS